MRFGARVNASTGFDATNYFLVIPTDSDEIVDTAFQILEDWAHKVSFEGEEIDKERGVVIEEWRLGLGAGSRVRDQQLPVLFSGSRYAERLPIGTLDVLQEFDYEAARRFYRDWYRPDLMAVIAVGDFDGEAIEAKIQEHFGRIPAAPDDARVREYEELEEGTGTRFAIVTDPEATLSTVEFYQFQPLRRQAYHGAYRRSIVEALFMRMFNRRLAEQAQQPNPPFLGAGASQDIFVPTAEAFVMGAGVEDGRVPVGLRALFAELERVARFGFTESELDRERRQLMRLFENIYTEQNVQESRLFAEEFTRAFLEGESTPGIDYEWALYQRFMPTITLEEVNEVGTTCFAAAVNSIRPGCACATSSKLFDGGRSKPTCSTATTRSGSFRDFHARTLAPRSRQTVTAHAPTGERTIRNARRGVSIMKGRPASRRHDRASRQSRCRRPPPGTQVH